jgi:hypothetical protein
VPLFWSQQATPLSPKPDILLQQFDPVYEVTGHTDVAQAALHSLDCRCALALTSFRSHLSLCKPQHMALHLRSTQVNSTPINSSTQNTDAGVLPFAVAENWRALL